MSEDWERDKKWSDRFLPEIKRILGEYLLVEPAVEEDMMRNTDLIILGFNSIRIGCRIRKHEYFAKYQNEFTIRADRPSGIKSELAKIISGWGDYLFYGFSDEAKEKLLTWRIISLNEFRLWFNYEIAREGKRPGLYLPNSDESSNFYAFDTTKMPPEIIFKKMDNMQS